ncbi:MAG TPA: DUF4252 domain-containing protein [Terracidiphilus sp.]|nr:DUF4252 domain-containing protein [Terracidiphilus sp.]
MKNRIIAFIFAAAVMAAPAPGQTAQTAPLPAPAPIEKELAARASNVDEVTLGKNMLAFASAFMKDKGKDKNDNDEASARQLIEGLEGIYVRDYEFDKEGQFTAEEADQLRKYYETGDWSPIVRERERKTGESTDVMVKLVNGNSRGLLILDVEPKEISIVLILGPIRMDELGKLKGLDGLGSLGALGGVQHSPRGDDKH